MTVSSSVNQGITLEIIDTRSSFSPRLIRLNITRELDVGHEFAMNSKLNSGLTHECDREMLNPGAKN